MAIDRTLRSNPLTGEGGDIEIEIENPEAVSIETEDGGVILDFDPDASTLASLGMLPHDANLADVVDDAELNVMASDLVGQFKSDKESRADWERAYVDGLDLLGLKNEDRTTPWDGACGVFHPLLSESVIKFQSQAIQELFPASGPVKTSVVGSLTDDKEKQAYRVQNYLNYLLTEKMTEYRSETEKMLFSLPLAGSAFRKIYYDPVWAGLAACLFLRKTSLSAMERLI